MKIYLCLCFLGLLTQQASSQVAINLDGSTPSDTKTMLEIKKPLYSKLKIRTTDYLNDTTVLEFSNRFGGQGSDFLFSHIKEEGLFISSASDLASNIKDSLMSIKLNGNVGIGVRNPAYNLQLNSPTSVNSLMNFTNTSTGIGTGDGLLLGLQGSSAILGNLESGNLRLGTSNLTRILIDPAGNVGVGNLTPAYKLDVNGDANITGAFRINGTSGTTGQVLTSNGVADPTWSNTALSNNVRFGVSMLRTSLTGTGALTVNQLYYNTNTSAISIGAIGTTDITFNQSGLYRIVGEMDGLLQGSGFTYTPEFTMNLFFTGGTALNYSLVTWKGMQLRGAVSNNWIHFDHYSLDIYITAPTTLQIGKGFLSNPGPTYTEANCTVFGYLISQ